MTRRNFFSHKKQKKSLFFIKNQPGSKRLRISLYSRSCQMKSYDYESDHCTIFPDFIFWTKSGRPSDRASFVHLYKKYKKLILFSPPLGLLPPPEDESSAPPRRKSTKSNTSHKNHYDFVKLNSGT